MNNSTQYAVGAAARFLKAHGHGNDYLVFGPGEQWSVTPDRVRRVCHPHRGVGADGLVVVLQEDARLRLRMFNPDGGEFERSGNGLRVAAVALRRWGLAPPGPTVVGVGGGDVTLRLYGESVGGRWDAEAELGRAEVGPEAVGLDPAAIGDGRMDHPELGPLEVLPVSVGNPHLVVFTSDLSDSALRAVGSFFASHPALKHGSNVQLVDAGDPLRIRIWERGVGPTTASGTSASAVAVAAIHTQRRPTGSLTIHMDGGEFEITVTPTLDVTLRGPIDEVAEGRLTEGFLAGLP